LAIKLAEVSPVIRPENNKRGRLLRRLAVISALACLLLTAGSAAADTGFTQSHIVSPTALTSPATQVEETTATLNGAVTGDGGAVCQYRFNYGTASGNYTFNTAWTGSLTTGRTFSANVTGLARGTKYYFRAQLKNCAGTGSGAELNFLTKPEAPASLHTTAVTDTRIDLAWLKGAGAQKTLVVRKTGGFPSNRNDGVSVYFDTGMSVPDTGLTPQTTYYYRAWSEVSGSEQWSDGYAELSATTGLTPPPPTTTPPVAVGGKVYPVNKAQVLAPWLIACSVLMLMAGCYIVKITLMHKGKSRGG
jgi:hypothetical protein